MKPTDTTTNLVTDPVCGMEIDPASAAGSSVYEGTTFYFCAASCKSEFDTGHGGVPTESASSCCGGCRCSNG